jgi:GLPGLI family protein
MKNFAITLLFLLTAAISANAQFKEGHIEYKVTVESDSPNNEAMIAMFSNSKMNIYFKNQMTRTEIDMGFMMSMKVINNEKSGEILMLMGGNAGKKAVLSSASEMDKTKSDSVMSALGNLQLINESKTILGYTCKKAILTNKDGTQISYWYTNEIVYNKKGNEIFDEQIPGVPLEMMTTIGGMTMKWTAVSYDKTIENETELFSMEIPSGYEQVTYSEYLKFKR